MKRYLDFLLVLLSQFAGGPSRSENNLVRFGLAAALLAALLKVAWSRQRRHDLPREKLLVWGFGLGLARELLMFAFTALQIIGLVERGATYSFFAFEAKEDPIASLKKLKALKPFFSEAQIAVGVSKAKEFLFKPTKKDLKEMKEEAKAWQDASLKAAGA